MVTEIDRLMAMKAVQRTALQELEREETGAQREEETGVRTKWLWLQPNLCLNGVFGTGNGFVELDWQHASSKLRNTVQTLSVQPRELHWRDLFSSWECSRNTACIL